MFGILQPQTAVRVLQAGQEYSLKKLFAQWQLPPQYHERMSSEWRCQLAHTCGNDAPVADAVMAAAPALLPESCGRRACAAVGADALAYVQVRIAAPSSPSRLCIPATVVAAPLSSRMVMAASA